MTDPMNQLEAELSGMQPWPLPENLADRIESELMASPARVSPWPDRFLLAAISSGAFAACVLVVVLLAGINGRNTPAISMQAMTFTSHPTESGATPLAFARSDPAWVELLK
jgi:hypothetical protein